MLIFFFNGKDYTRMSRDLQLAEETTKKQELGG